MSAEQFPLDPFSGIVNYMNINRLCPPSTADEIVASSAALLGIGVCRLASETDEDWRVIDAIVGVQDVTVEQELEAIKEKGFRARVKDARPHLVVMTRFSGDPLDYEKSADRHVLLLEVVRDLVDRLN